MNRMQQWADFILEAVRFRSTSGNQVTRISELGEDGVGILWKTTATDQDQEEFTAWARTMFPANANFTRHVEGLISKGGLERSLERSRQAYVAWKKKNS